MVYQHFQDGTTKKFPCSTGNRALKDGIATREGIFTVQWMSKRYMSQRFETWLNYWMPFDGGIGFHGLDGRSYYKYLGRRPSSHGCVRISNETGRELYKETYTGTIVYVHNGSPARLLTFATPADTSNLRIIDEQDTELLAERLDAVHRCQENHPALTEQLAIKAGKKKMRSIAVGRAIPSMRIQHKLAPLATPLFTGPSPVEQPMSLLHRSLFEQTSSKGKQYLSR